MRSVTGMVPPEGMGVGPQRRCRTASQRALALLEGTRMDTNAFDGREDRQVPGSNRQLFTELTTMSAGDHPVTARL